MNLFFTLFAALPLGYLLSRRAVALTTYLIADSFVFSYQSVWVLLTWMSGDNGLGGASGFGPTPRGPLPVDHSTGELLAYGLVNLVITLAGIGLVVLGTKLRARGADQKVAVDVG